MREGVCIHYNGTQNKVCRAGICYDDVTPAPGAPGSGLRLPCFSRPLFGERMSPAQRQSWENRGTCVKFQEPTPEQIAADEADCRAFSLNCTKARAAIIQHAAGKAGIIGALPCPICGNGTLKYSIAGCNGHVHAACSTEDCVRWME